MSFQFQQQFDARQVEPSSFSLIPAGDYPAHIIASEAVPTNSGDGGMLKLELEILDGPAKGKHLFWNLNLFNKNPQAVEIAYKQLSAICHVTGVFNVQDSGQLHGKPFIAIVTNDGQYNNVKGVKDVYGNAPGKAAAAAPVAANAPLFAPPAAAPVTPPQPWAHPVPATPWPNAAPAQPPAAPPGAPATPPWAQPVQQPAAAPAAPTWAPPQAPAAAAPSGAVPPWAQSR